MCNEVLTHHTPTDSFHTREEQNLQDAYQAGDFSQPGELRGCQELYLEMYDYAFKEAKAHNYVCSDNT